MVSTYPAGIDLSCAADRAVCRSKVAVMTFKHESKVTLKAQIYSYLRRGTSKSSDSLEPGVFWTLKKVLPQILVHLAQHDNKYKLHR